MKNKTIENVLDQLIDEATENIKNKIDSSEVEEVEVKFSKEHQEKMKEIFRKSREREKFSIFNYHVPKIAAVATILIAIGISAAGTVAALKGNLINNNLKIKEKYSEITSGFIDNYYYYDNIYFGYLPQDFECKDEKNLENKRKIFFSNADETKYIFLQENINNTELKISNEEYTILEEICINEREMVYAENINEKLVYWKEGNNSYTIYSNIGKNDLLKVAEKLLILGD